MHNLSFFEFPGLSFIIHLACTPALKPSESKKSLCPPMCTVSRVGESVSRWVSMTTDTALQWKTISYFNVNGTTQENRKINAQKPKLLNSLQTRGFIEQKSWVSSLGLWILLIGPCLGKKLISIFWWYAAFLALSDLVYGRCHDGRLLCGLKNILTMSVCR